MNKFSDIWSKEDNYTVLQYLVRLCEELDLFNDGILNEVINRDNKIKEELQDDIDKLDNKTQSSINNLQEGIHDIDNDLQQAKTKLNNDIEVEKERAISKENELNTNITNVNDTVTRNNQEINTLTEQLGYDKVNIQANTIDIQELRTQLHDVDNRSIDNRDYKQDKTDELLTTEDKTIVGAINELNAKPSGSGDKYYRHDIYQNIMDVPNTSDKLICIHTMIINKSPNPISSTDDIILNNNNSRRVFFDINISPNYNDRFINFYNGTFIPYAIQPYISTSNVITVYSYEYNLVDISQVGTYVFIPIRITKGDFTLNDGWTDMVTEIK